GLALAAQVGTCQQGAARQHLDDEHFVVRPVDFAAHAIAAHDAQASPGGPGPKFLRTRADQQVSTARSRDLGVEFVGGGGGCHSCSIASIVMQSSDYLVWIDLEMTGLKPDTDVI